MANAGFWQSDGYTIRCRIPIPEYDGYIYGYARRHEDNFNRLSVIAQRSEMPPRWVEKTDQGNEGNYFSVMKFEVLAKDIELLDCNDNPLTGNEDTEDMTW